MNRMKTMTTLFAVLLTTMVSAYGQTAVCDPEDIARRCVTRVDDLVERCENAVRDQTRRAVPVIRRLLACGQKKEAHAVARRAHRASQNTVRRCTEEIESVRDRCIDVLLSMGARRLARRVHGYCEDAIEGLQTLLERQRNIFKDILDGD